MKKDVRSLTHDELISFFESNNHSSYRATQVYEWLWKKSCFSFDEMTNLSKNTRELLKDKFVINHIKIDKIPMLNNIDYIIDISGSLENKEGKKDLQKINYFLNNIRNYETYKKNSSY